MAASITAAVLIGWWFLWHLPGKAGARDLERLVNGSSRIELTKLTIRGQERTVWLGDEKALRYLSARLRQANPARPYVSGDVRNPAEDESIDSAPATAYLATFRFNTGRWTLATLYTGSGNRIRVTVPPHGVSSLLRDGSRYTVTLENPMLTAKEGRPEGIQSLMRVLGSEEYRGRNYVIAEPGSSLVQGIRTRQQWIRAGLGLGLVVICGTLVWGLRRWSRKWSDLQRLVNGDPEMGITGVTLEHSSRRVVVDDATSLAYLNRQFRQFEKHARKGGRAYFAQIDLNTGRRVRGSLNVGSEGLSTHVHHWASYFWVREPTFYGADLDGPVPDELRKALDQLASSNERAEEKKEE